MSRVDRLPQVLRTLTMMVWVWYGGCYTEIATGFSSYRNDSFIIAMTMCGYCYYLEQGDEAIHNYYSLLFVIEKLCGSCGNP